MISRLKTFLLWIGIVVTFTIRPITAIAATPQSIEFSAVFEAYRPGATTNDNSGEPSSIGTPFFYLGALYHYPLRSFFLSPWIKYSPESLDARQARGSKSTSSSLAFGTTATLNAGASWDFGVGPTISRRTIHGTGGAKESLPNANSEIDFFTPSKTVTSATAGIQFVTGWQRNKFRTTLEFLRESPLSSTRAATSLTVSGAYVWK